MARHEMVKKIEDEQRYQKYRCRLGHQNGRCVVCKPAIDTGERGFDAERANHSVLPLALVVQRILPRERRVFGIPTELERRHITRAARLADFDATDVRKPKERIELEPQLSFVQVPETFGQAVQVGSTNSLKSRLDVRDISAVVAVELNRGQDEGDEAAY